MMTLLPFGSVQSCPQCQYPIAGGFAMKYSTSHVVPGFDGEFINVHKTGESLIPHLELHCGRCGYGWLEETAEAARAKREPTTETTIFGRARSFIDAVGGSGCKATIETQRPEKPGS